MSRKNITVLPALAACALLAGCGGTAGHTSDSASRAAAAYAPPPSYAAAGNAICAAQVARLNTLPRPTTPEQTIAYLPPALAAMHREIAQLTTLDPPGAAGERLAAALASTRALAGMLSSFLHELRQGTVEFAQLATVQQRSTTLRAVLDARFRQAGLARCAQ